MIKLTRRCAGEYEYKIRNTVFTVAQNNERDSSWYGNWIISDSAHSVSDPIPTLAHCREALAHMENNPDLYDIR
jgi:hypothetical protein